MREGVKHSESLPFIPGSNIGRIRTSVESLKVIKVNKGVFCEGFKD